MPGYRGPASFFDHVPVKIKTLLENPRLGLSVADTQDPVEQETHQTGRTVLLVPVLLIVILHVRGLQGDQVRVHPMIKRRVKHGLPRPILKDGRQCIRITATHRPEKRLDVMGPAFFVTKKMEMDGRIIPRMREADKKIRIHPQIEYPVVHFDIS